MFTRSLSREEMSRAYEMLLQPLLSAADLDGIPFGSVYGIVEPQTTSKGHRHNDSEMFIILSGEGVVRIDGEARTLRDGDVAFIPPFTSHSLTNSSPTAELEMISIYWDEPAAAVRALAERPGPRPRAARVVCPPPTPNGGLHLGHIAGPYLRADVYRRAAAAHGLAVALVTGTDDHQTYVDVRARRDDEDPRRLAARHGDAVMRTLKRLDIDVACAIRPASTDGYRETVRAGFERLLAAGVVQERQITTAHCPRCEQSLYQAYVKGGCPTCGRETDGEICESCGFPNDALALANPICSLCGDPASQRLEAALVLSLEAYRERLRSHIRETPHSEHTIALVERLLEAGLPDYRLTRAGRWGLPVPREDMDGHVIDAWVELMLGQHVPSALGVLDGRHGEPAGRGEPGEGAAPPGGEPVEDFVQFIGYDNSFYYAVLFPVLSFALEDYRCRPTALIANEFLYLEGEKFSTSRDHAIWADDALRVSSADALRLAMLRCSPEDAVEDFTAADFDAAVGGALVRPIERWLSGLRALSESLGARAPTPGAWTGGHRDFFAHLEDALGRFSETLSLEAFSAQRYAELIFELVKRATHFHAREQHTLGLAARAEEERTVQALELVAAKVFAIVAHPAMPQAAGRLWAELGLPGPPRWEPHVTFLTTGAELSFSPDPYFAIDAQ